MNPTTMLALAALNTLADGNTSRIIGEISTTARKPNTTDGMPASTSSIGFTTSRTGFDAYSLR